MLRLMVVKRRGAVLSLIATVVATLALAVAPMHSSQNSYDGASCATAFGYASLMH